MMIAVMNIPSKMLRYKLRIHLFPSKILSYKSRINILIKML